MNRLFDLYIAVDWSARNIASPVKPSSDALWVGEKDLMNNSQKETYFRTRFECVSYITNLLRESVLQNKRVIIGYDFDFGFPSGFAESIGLSNSEPKWLELWKKLNELIVDNEDNSNNRFEVANILNSLCMIKDSSIVGPLWGCPVNTKLPYLNPKGSIYPFTTRVGKQLSKFRNTEMLESKAQPVWKLIGSASVGGQTLVGIPALYKLRFNNDLATFSKVWPFETGFSISEMKQGHAIVLHVEIWPGILSAKLDKSIRIKDQAQVRAVVDWMSYNDQVGKMFKLLTAPIGLSKEAEIEVIDEEGWVIGMGTMKNTQDLNTARKGS